MKRRRTETEKRDQLIRDTPEKVEEIEEAAKTVKRLIAEAKRSFADSVVLQTWRRAKIVPILKSGKPATELSSFRPVSLIFRQKWLEQIIEKRLRIVLEKNEKISNWQAGFRSGSGWRINY